MSEPRLCIVDHRTELGPAELQTCIRCQGATRCDLLDIADMYPLLDAELTERAGAATPPEPNGHIHGDTNPLPGGDVMVMLSPGSPATNQARDIVRGRYDDAAHANDEYPDDPPSVLGELERWDTDWRTVLGHRMPDQPATVTACVEYLGEHLAHAAQNHPAFDEFASDLRKIKQAMESALRAGPQRSPVPCITCGAKALERPEPRDDGRRFEWQCGKCHTNYTEPEYWMAVRQQGEAM